MIDSAGTFDRLAKPHYLFRPDQLIRRWRNDITPGPDKVVRVAWGLPLEVCTTGSVGSGIARTGVHELAITEAMWRLLDDQDAAVDVGANVGYFTSLMALRASRVVALEPHPPTRRLLERNVARWGELGARVTVDARAASDRAATLQLHLPHDFETNQGSATLETTGEDLHAFDVATVRLDDVVRAGDIGLMKIDIEGHEAAAFTGAAGALAAGRVRDIIFEEHDDVMSAPAPGILVAHGYEILGLEPTLRGVRVVPPGSAAARPRWDAPTYIATRAPERARARLSRPGWRSLRPRLTRVPRPPSAMRRPGHGRRPRR